MTESEQPDTSRGRPVPSFHDGYLTGIVTLPQDRVLLLVRDVAGERHQVLLSGVERFRADNFLKGNIILDLELVAPEHCRREDALFLLGYAGEPTLPVQRAGVDGLLERLRASAVRLVRMNPSLGCELACVCARIEVDPAPAIDVSLA